MNAPADLEAFQTRLGYRFQRPELLHLALTHPSVTHENSRNREDNQRLEFLGDAVLGMVLARELYLRLAGHPEGVLTKTRAQLVNRHSLEIQARALGLGSIVQLSRGEELQGGRERTSTLADAFEAVVGAIYLDGGFEAASGFLLRVFERTLDETEPAAAGENPKGDLQEYLQGRSSSAPTYRVITSSGPDHARVFECLVEHEGVELGRGEGGSKKEAETSAARHALQLIQKRPGAGAA